MKVSPKRAALIAVAAVLVVFLAVTILQFTQSEPRLAATNSIGANVSSVPVEGAGAHRVCANGQWLPSTADRVEFVARSFGAPGVPVRVSVRLDGKEVAAGSSPRFNPGSATSVKLSQRTADLNDATVCLTFVLDRGTPRVAFAGDGTGGLNPISMTRIDGADQPFDIALTYWLPNDRSLASMLGTIADRAGLMRPTWYGDWMPYTAIAIALLACLAAMFAFACGTVDRFSTRGAALLVVGVALVNALAWGVVTPAFQPPDEAGHFWYVEHLAHRGDEAGPAHDGDEATSSQRTNLVLQVNARSIILRPPAKPFWNADDEAAWRAADDALKAQGDVGRGPPSWMHYSQLYYLPAVAPYELLGEADPITKTVTLRPYSALLAALTALFVFLACIELLPGQRSSAVVAGLAVAFLPMFAHIGGAINNDNMAIMLVAATLYLLTRAYRRRLDWRYAIAIAAVGAAAALAKPTAIGVMPAVFMAVIALAWRDAEGWRRASLTGASLAVFIGVLFVALVGLGLSNDAYSDVAAGGTGQAMSVTGFLSYLWQWYVPRLPFMEPYFDDTLPVYGVFFRGFLGLFNHLDTPFPEYVYTSAVLVAFALLGSLVLLGWRERANWREWAPAATIAMLVVIGVCLVVNAVAYKSLVTNGNLFAQGRYLLPLVPVFGLAFALGARALGGRWHRAVEAALLTALGLLNVTGMWIALERFYL